MRSVFFYAQPPNQNGTWVKDALLRRENVLGKLQYSKRCFEMMLVFRRDERSHVLIGADGTWRSDWPERVCAVDVRARSDR